MNATERLAKLALGTAQFGLAYGVANQRGQLPVEEAHAILQHAEKAGLRTLDTAIAYGSSEAVLGGTNLGGFEVITKLSAVPDGCSDVEAWVATELEGSLARLNIARIDGLLLHRPAQLLEASGAALYNALSKQREQGLVRRIGISIYAPEELDQLLERYQLDLVQAPFNIMDTRLRDSGWLERLARSGTRLHVRSVFMQGLLLMSKQARPAKFDRWSAHWSLWQDWLKQTGLTPLQACLRHALAVPEIERVVVGVDSLAQLVGILHAAQGEFPEPPAALACGDVELLNPSLWNSL
ncbi:aldo/keto reductase [Stutzerimonas kunmingensis]|uniref:aldo/keto reductase n=1 Tax=Stutzerimonas kunmingensis TaxID=1211807 RepID=UPI0028AD77D1|nr:aldo/keto reductase [Stutzerimonas kunmingensis]